MALPESDAKGEEGEAERPNPMGRFKGLARGLLNVQPAELREAERRYQEKREAARIAPRGPDPSPN